MPILDIEIVTARPLDRGLASRLADMAGEVFGGPPGNTWVRVRALAPECFAENGIAEPEGHRSVFVKVLKARLPAGEALAAEMRALAEGVARACDRKLEHVHILYEPEAQGRIAFGGCLKW